TSKISDFADFEKRLKEVLRSNFGKDRIDFLVNNAGVGIHTEMGQTTEEQFDQLMNIHVKGVVFLTQRMLAMMNDGGGIINVSSGLARFAMPGYSVYGSLKAAMDMYTRYEAKE